MAQADLLMDVEVAARYAEVSRDDLQRAITARQIEATNLHPRRPGVWMVRLRDVDAWVTWSQSGAC